MYDFGEEQENKNKLDEWLSDKWSKLWWKSRIDVNGD
jgi:hypothetical protein